MKHSFRCALAIMLSILLVMGNPGFAAFADDVTPGLDGSVLNDEEELFSSDDLPEGLLLPGNCSEKKGEDFPAAEGEAANVPSGLAEGADENVPSALAEAADEDVPSIFAEAADENPEIRGYIVTEEEAAGELTAEALDVTTEVTPETGEETTANVETDGFSIYQVEFTYNKLEYVLPGDTSVALSEILSTLGLTGEVTAVEISDTSLFSASDEIGAWIVTALQPFSTTEWMKVTINGVAYEITVTDSVTGAGTEENPYVVDSWNSLKEKMALGGYIQLGADVSDPDKSSSSFQSVPSGVTVTLDLNGHTIDRGLFSSNAIEKGYVIYVAGNLTITDSGTGGKITGGNNTGQGGGVYVDGTFFLKGGIITQNKALIGGGVCISEQNSSLYVLSGTIEGNTTHSDGTAGTANVHKWYGSFYLKTGITIEYTSTPTRFGNVTVNSTAHGTVMVSEATLTVDGTKYHTGGETVTVTLMPESTDYALTSVSVTGTGGDVALSGSGDTRTFTMPDYDVTVSAVFTDIDFSAIDTAAKLRQALARAVSCRLAADISGVSDLSVSAAVTLDLNGYTISGTGTNGVLSIGSGGNLTLIDTSAAQTGNITGGDSIRGVYVNGGTFTLQGGTITGKSDNGGGVHVASGTAIMNGGAISGCGVNSITGKGGGVYVAGGSFTLNDGTISNNSAYSGGGLYLAGGTAAMNGGTITNCSAVGQGGGITTAIATFTLTGGMIVGNRVTSGNYGGGGIYVGSTIYVSGSPVVKNNQLRDYIDDIRLYSGINIIGALKPGATLRISAKSSGDTVASLKKNSTYVITDDDALAFRSSDDTLVGEASSDGQQVTFKQKETETYDVTITAGTGMTKTTSSGAISQTEKREQCHHICCLRGERGILLSIGIPRRCGQWHQCRAQQFEDYRHRHTDGRHGNHAFRRNRMGGSSFFR